MKKISEVKEVKERKVFLGGTCNDSEWREMLIPLLDIPYFNPVVEDWTPECYEEEMRQKNEVCKFQLFVITPRMKGVFSIAEAVDASNKIPDNTVFCVLNEDRGNKGEIITFDKAEKKSLDAVCKLVRANGSHVCESLVEVSEVLNNL